jgi:mRNA interferase YafQ
MLLVERTNQFKKDYKLAKRRGRDLALLDTILKKIANQEAIETKHRDHPLTGNWYGHRELHVENDWLLIYQLMPSKQTVVFVRTGTHSDLF